jgi:quercetin dioxygenase-like cupin family protein
MRRFIVTTFLVASFCAVGVAAQSTAVSINNEPHHTRLLYTNDLRMWDVTLAPGESTPPFVHEYDVATVVVGDGTLNIQRNGESVAPPAPNARGSVIVTEHTAAKPTAYRIENNGTTAYRALEIENMHETKQSPPFTISDLTLKVGDGPAMHQHTGATIIVLVSGTLEQEGIGGTDAVRIQQPGQWLSLPRFQAHTIRAIGGETHAVEIEVR